MIDLTPLEVRNKRGDFKKIMRGYDPHDVDAFLEIAADRLEMLVRENLQLRERAQTLQNQVEAQIGREQAVQDALVTAQALRADIQAQTQREAESVLREAEVEARRMLAEAETEVRTRLRDGERRLDHAHDSIRELERRRVRFLMEFRSLLEREMDVVEVEAGRAPFEARTIDLDLGSRSRERGEWAGSSSVAGGDGADEARGTASAGAPQSSDAEGKPDPAPSTGPDESPRPARRSAPPADVGDQPSSLEVELMAGAGDGGLPGERERFADIPDLETLLAGSGERLEPSTPGDGRPSPAAGVSRDNAISADPNDPDRES